MEILLHAAGTMRRALFAFTVLLLCVPGLVRADAQSESGRPETAESQEPTSFEEAQLLARHDEENASLDWRHQSSARLGPALSITNKCLEGMEPADVPSLHLVVKLSFQGRATRVLVKEDSTYARCFADRLRLLDLGSAPWDGYWLEIVMASPVETSSSQLQFLSFSGEPCVRATGAAASTTPALTLTTVTPSSGAAITPETRISFAFSYSVPKGPNDQYKLIALVDTITPGKAAGLPPIDFPYPATCGSEGSLTASLQVGVLWHMPDLSKPIRIRLAILSAANYQIIAQSEWVEFSK